VKFELILLVYCLLLIFLAIFSYGFVDANFPLKTSSFLYNLVHFHRPLTTGIYTLFIVSLFGFYFYFLDKARRQQITIRQVKTLILFALGVLLFSFPAFSYDIFNYIATAKVTFFYKENPYLVMPIEFLGEPMLKFMHAANKYALYAPFWILLTAIPYFLGLGRIVLTVFTFKAFIACFYLISVWLVWRLSAGNLYSLVFFALNPLVIIETLVSGHNDVVMMTFALIAFLLLFQKRKLLSLISLFSSIGIKYATIVLTPLFVFSFKFKKEKLIAYSAWLMFIVFLLSPLREEIYSWYFIWVISFAALLPKDKFLFWLVIGFSLGLLLRHIPWLYFRNWGGFTPKIKTLATFIPPGITLFGYFLKLFSK